MVKRVAVAEQDRVSRRDTARKSNSRAASMPIQREGPILDFVSRQKPRGRLSSMSTDDVPSPSLPSIVVVRGRKRASSSLASPEPDPIASTSTSTDFNGDVSGKPSRKRLKRSSSTPPAPKLSQITTQLKSRRRSRSRVGSPTMDLEYVPPARISARLARKTHPFIISRSSDIYTHLADPSGGGNLLSDPPSGSIMLSTPNNSVTSRSVKKLRGRPKKIVDLTDENVKSALMEEWARIRQSQGALPLLERDEHTPTSQDGDSFASASRLEAITQRCSTRPEGDNSQATTVVDIAFSQETLVDISTMDVEPSPHSPTQLNFDTDLPVGASSSIYISKDNVDDNAPATNDASIAQMTGLDPELLSTAIPESHLQEDPLAGETTNLPVATHQPSRLQKPAESSSPKPFPLPVQSVSMDSNLIYLPMSDREPSPLRDSSEGGHSVTPPAPTRTLVGGDVHLEDDAEFHLLDVPEIFTLPWEPDASHMYVPSGLGKLIAGMRGQLTVEARARRKAEDLYQSELVKRVAAEKLVRELRAELEHREHIRSRRLPDEPPDEVSLHH